MENITNDQVQSLLKRHMDDNVHVVYMTNEGVVLKTGRLLSISHKDIAFKPESSNESEFFIPYEERGKKILLHVYNQSLIDLTKAKQTASLATKLKHPDFKKVIIANLKPQLQKDLSFIFKSSKGLAISTGLFENMGIMGLLIKAAPFYNKEVSLQYDVVLHIYNNDANDFLDGTSHVPDLT